MGPDFITIHIRRNHPLPLFRQVYEKIRDDILLGRLPPGTRLPATRQLAAELDLSRNVILEAYDQLRAEGYIESRPGSYTRVSPDTFYRHYKKKPFSAPLPPKKAPAREISFRTGIPDLSRFPRVLWGQCLKKAAMEAGTLALAYSSPRGHEGLRQVLADYLYRIKGIQVTPRQIIITSGATQALSLLAGIGRRPGSRAVIEDPGGVGVIHILKTAGFSLHAAPTDDQGMLPERLRLPPRTRLICTTPSHQFPMGGILSAARRIQLLELAREKDLTVVEDDYDSEFRYEGSPIHPLKALDPEKVVYIGSFSKVLSPALRLGYAVLPDHLLAPFRELKQYADAQSPMIEQIALARFIRSGEFERHVFKMKKIYRQKRDALVTELADVFRGRVRIFGENAGLHLVGQFPGHRFETRKGFKVRHNGVAVDTVERHALEKGRHRDKLIFGYGNLSRDQIRTGIRRLRHLISDQTG